MQSAKMRNLPGPWILLLAMSLTAVAETASSQPSPPVITAQPQSHQAKAGENVQFTVGASGTPLLTYQWYVNGLPFSGATSEILLFSDARSTDSGVYFVRVTNAYGTATSQTVTLTVKPAQAPLPVESAGGSHNLSRVWLALVALALAAVLIALARPPRRHAPSIFLHSE